MVAAEQTSNTVSEELVWQWLGDVPDPEIPVISVVELGIIRSVEWQGDQLLITVTLTYSGCPATRIIEQDIDTALRQKGLDNIMIKRQLSPPWTTDWISQSGRDKLKHYGIVPPASVASDKPVCCPRCDSKQTELISQFGSTPCKSSYRCLDCLEPFDYFKCI